MLFVNENTPSEIGYEITRRMLDQGLNTRDLAKKAVISDKSISRLRNGHVTTAPQNKTLKKIADALGCKPTELVFREGGEHGNDRSEDPQSLPG